MTWDIPLKLGGPVLRWELVRAARSLGARLVRYGCLGWIVIQFLALTGDLPTDKHVPQAMKDKLSANSPVADVQIAEAAGRVSFANYAVATLLEQQLLLLVLVTPFVAATALGREKERDTFAALLCTELRSREIVLGKFLGRLAVLGQALLGAVPLFIILAVLGEFSLVAVLVAFVQLAILLFAFTAACLVVAVWARQTRDALLGCYAAITVIGIGERTILAGLPVPAWLDPLEVLRRLCGPHGLPSAGLLVAHFAFWLGVGAGCLVLATSRLRAACLGQLEGRQRRRRWSFRPQVGTDPVRWRERYVIGLAPIPWLRRIPTWLGLVGVLTFSAVLAAAAIEGTGGRSFVEILWTGDLDWVGLMLTRGRHTISDHLMVMGGLLALAAPVVVGIRCAGCIAEERRRKTWEDLILTPLTVDRIVWGKMWGIVEAALPYLIAYAAPMIAFGALGGFGEAAHAALWVLGAGLLCVAVAAMWAPLQISAADPWFEPPPPPPRRDRLDYHRPLPSPPEKAL